MASSSSLTIYSGGAKGVDTTVERLCHQKGHHCVIYIPPCDVRARATRSFPPLGTPIQPLTYKELHEAGPYALQASVRMGKRVTDPITQQYVCRNWHIIKEATLVLAFGFLDSMKKHVQGGTGWTVDMAKAKNLPIYVFDLNYEEWFWWDGHSFRCIHEMWQCGKVDMHERPTLQDQTAIVGTRELYSGYVNELKRLFSSYRP